MEHVLKNSNYFAYVPMAQVKSPSQSFETEKEHIRYICKENNLRCAVKVFMEYDINPGFDKQLALSCDWTLFRFDGTELIRVHTLALSEPVGHFPSTRDPQFEDIWIGLAKKSAEDFLSMLGGTLSKHE